MYKQKIIKLLIKIKKGCLVQNHKFLEKIEGYYLHKFC